jgi:hypothetical protein
MSAPREASLSQFARIPFARPHERKPYVTYGRSEKSWHEPE